MKKICFIIFICIILIFIGRHFYLTNNLEEAREQGEYYIFREKRYTRVGGEFEKGKLIAKVLDSNIKLYEVKGDKNNYYLVDSFGDLYVNENYKNIDIKITGVFFDSIYYDNNDLCKFISNLNNEINGKDMGILNQDNMTLCEIYNTTDSNEVHLCYDNMKASDKIIGDIVYKNDNYYFVDQRTILRENKPYGYTGGFEGVQISSSYKKILDKYF